MNIAVVGAGALGAVYGARLALLTQQQIAFVVREARASRGGSIAIQRIDGDNARHEIPTPNYVTRVPDDTSVIVVTARQDQLDEAMIALLKASKAPVVVLSPMFQRDQDRFTSALGARIFPAMPSVVSYEKNGLFRYWLPRAATTLVESSNAPDAVKNFVESCCCGGISARLQEKVLAENVATTVSFMPIVAALDVAGSVDALMEDDKLLHMAIGAVKESSELARVVGAPAAWAGLLLRFVGAFTIKAGVALARRGSPEAVAYVEDHFGRKLHAQNLRMSKTIVELAEEKEIRADQLHALYMRLQEVQ